METGFVFPGIEYPLIVAKPRTITLPTGESIPILYEDRAVMAIDKPAGWMLVPFSWQKTPMNLQAALTSSIAARDFWARSRNLRFLRFMHRLDAETTGILLLGKSPGAVQSFSRLFEDRRMGKEYLAVVDSVPRQSQWICRLPIGPDPAEHGRMRVDPRGGKQAETKFEVVESRSGRTLIRAFPQTGRTHQIRLHLAANGTPIVNDPLYHAVTRDKGLPFGLRAVSLRYQDPFSHRTVVIHAPEEGFRKQFGFDAISPVVPVAQGAS